MTVNQSAEEMSNGSQFHRFNRRANRFSKKPGFRLALDLALIVLVGITVLSYRLPFFRPQLYVQQPVFNFGQVQKGELVKANFTVRNLHPYTVTLTKLQGSCGCTQPIADHPLLANLASLESVVVRATLDTSGKQGKVSQTIAVITKDNLAGTALSIEGTVTP